MIRPVAFRMNEQTAINNYYQKVLDGLSPETVKGEKKPNVDPEEIDEESEDNNISKFLLRESAQILADYLAFKNPRNVVQNKSIVESAAK